MFTVYTMSDPAAAASAMTSMALFFDTTGQNLPGTIIKLGLLSSLLFILAQGVLAKKGLRIDVLLLQFIVVYGAFLPKTDVIIEDFDLIGAPRIVEDVPLAIALPAAAASSFSYFMTEKIMLATASVNTTGFSLEEMKDFWPATTFLKYATCPSDPLKCIPRNLAETMASAIRFCGTGELSNVRFAESSNVLNDLASGMQDLGETLIFDSSDPYGGPGRQVSCADARRYLMDYASGIGSGNYGAEGDPNSFHSFVENIQGEKYDVNEGMQQLMAFSDQIMSVNALTLFNLMSYAAADQLQKKAGDPLDMAVTLQRDRALFDWVNDQTYAAAMEASMAAPSMDLLFFVFIVSTPLVMFFILANPSGGLKVAGVHALLGVWSQSWMPMMAIILAWYQSQINTFDLPLNTFVGDPDGAPSVEAVARMLEHIAKATGAAAEAVTKAPMWTMALMTGSMFAFVSAFRGGSTPAQQSGSPVPGSTGSGSGSGSGGGSGLFGMEHSGRLKAAMAGVGGYGQGGMGGLPGFGGGMIGTGMSEQLGSQVSKIAFDGVLSQQASYLEKEAHAARSALSEQIGERFNILSGLSGSTRMGSHGGKEESSGTDRQRGENSSWQLSDEHSQGHGAAVDRTGTKANRSGTSEEVKARLAAGKKLFGKIADEAQKEGLSDIAAVAKRGENAADAGNLGAAQAAERDLSQALQAHAQSGGATGRGLLSKVARWLPEMKGEVSGSLGANAAQQGETRSSISQRYDEGHKESFRTYDESFDRTALTNSSKTSGGTRAERGIGTEHREQQDNSLTQSVQRAAEAQRAFEAARSATSQFSGRSSFTLDHGQAAAGYNMAMVQNGMQSSDAGTALSRLMMSLRSNFGNNQDAFQQLEQRAAQNLNTMRRMGQTMDVAADNSAAYAALSALSSMANNPMDGQTQLQSMLSMADIGQRAGLMHGFDAEPLRDAAAMLSEGTAGVSGAVSTRMAAASATPSAPLSGNMAERRAQVAPLISAAANQHGVSAAMLHGMIRQESGYQSNAQSHAGAQGIAQFMPETGARYGLNSAADRMDPNKAIPAMAHHMSDLMNAFSGYADQAKFAMAAYNLGEGSFSSNKGVKGAIEKAANAAGIDPKQVSFEQASRYMPEETRNYVPAIMGHIAREQGGVSAAVGNALANAGLGGGTGGWGNDLQDRIAAQEEAVNSEVGAKHAVAGFSSENYNPHANIEKEAESRGLTDNTGEVTPPMAIQHLNDGDDMAIVQTAQGRINYVTGHENNDAEAAGHVARDVVAGSGEVVGGAIEFVGGVLDGAGKGLTAVGFDTAGEAVSNAGDRVQQTGEDISDASTRISHEGAVIIREENNAREERGEAPIDSDAGVLTNPQASVDNSGGGIYSGSIPDAGNATGGGFGSGDWGYGNGGTVVVASNLGEDMFAPTASKPNSTVNSAISADAGGSTKPTTLIADRLA